MTQFKNAAELQNIDSFFAQVCFKKSKQKTKFVFARYVLFVDVNLIFKRIMNVTPKTVPATKRLGLSRSLGRNPITSTLTPKANLVSHSEVCRLYPTSNFPFLIANLNSRHHTQQLRHQNPMQLKQSRKEFTILEIQKIFP